MDLKAVPTLELLHELQSRYETTLFTGLGGTAHTEELDYALSKGAELLDRRSKETNPGAKVFSVIRGMYPHEAIDASVIGVLDTLSKEVNPNNITLAVRLINSANGFLIDQWKRMTDQARHL